MAQKKVKAMVKISFQEQSSTDQLLHTYKLIPIPNLKNCIV